MLPAKIEQEWYPLFLQVLKYVRIRSKEVAAIDEHGAPLNLWSSQKKALEEIVSGMEEGIRMFLFLKSRQLGMTTITLLIDIFFLAYYPGTLGALVTDNDENRDKFRETLRQYIESFPKNMFGKRFQILKDNDSFMSFSNGSRLDFIVAGRTKENWGEGGGYALVHMCMAKGTPVVLEHGRIKSIEDVRIGDKVLTHTGKVTTVIDAIGQPNTKGDMIKITPWLGHAVLCTDDHKFPTQRGMIKAKSIKKTDCLIMPVRKITNDKQEEALDRGNVKRERNRNKDSAGLGKIIKFTEELGFGVGYYLAEGHMIHSAKKGFATGIVFTRHKNEKRYADRAIAGIREYISGSRRSRRVKNSLTCTDVIYGSRFCQWIEDNFGSKDKKIIPDKVFTLGEDFCRGLLSGILCGDGSKNAVYANNGKYKLNNIVLPTTRSSLAMQTRDIAASLGYGWGAIRYKEAGNHYGRICKPCWRIHWNGSAAQKLRPLMGLTKLKEANTLERINKYKIVDGLVYLKIRKIEYGFKEKTMWDLSVSHSDHTFRTPYMSTSNTEIASYGKAKGISSFRETLSQTNPNRLFIGESTAKGMNHYKRMWEEFKSDKFTKKAIFLGWYYNDMNIIRENDRRFAVFGEADPDPVERELIAEVEKLYGYKISQEQLAWYRWKHSDRSAREEDLHQNQPFNADQAFVLTGYSYFQMAVLGKEYERCCAIQFAGYKYIMGTDFWDVICEEITDINRLREVTLRVWEPPIEDAWYVIGCDPAYGRGEFKNRHAISVWRVFANKMVQVAEYADNEAGTRQCAWVLAHLAGAYKKCAINVEINGPGGVIITEMENLREKALLDPRFEKLDEKDSNKNWDNFLMTAKWYLYRKPDHFSASGMKGVESTAKLKHQMMSQLRDKFVTEQLLIHSSLCIREMMNVIQDGDSIGAVDPNTDDRVFAMAYAVRAWIDELAMPLLAQGETYEAYLSAGESQTVDKASKMMNNIIENFFKTREEESENPPVSREKQWLYDRGFL